MNKKGLIALFIFAIFTNMPLHAISQSFLKGILTTVSLGGSFTSWIASRDYHKQAETVLEKELSENEEVKKKFDELTSQAHNLNYIIKKESSSANYFLSAFLTSLWLGSDVARPIITAANISHLVSVLLPKSHTIDLDHFARQHFKNRENRAQLSALELKSSICRIASLGLLASAVLAVTY